MGEEWRIPDVTLSGFLKTDLSAIFQDGADTSGLINSFKGRLGNLDSLKDKITFDPSTKKLKIGETEFTASDLEDTPANRTKLNSALVSSVSSADLPGLKSNVVDADLGNPTAEEQKTTVQKGVDNNQPQHITNSFNFYGFDKDPAGAWQKVQTDLMTKAGPILGKVIKYTIIGTISYEVLNGLATARSGCYASYGSSSTMIDPSLDATTCVFNTTNPSASAVLTDCKGACQQYISNTYPATVGGSNLQAGSCNCLDSSGNLVAPNGH